MPATLNAVYANGDFALENGLGTVIDYSNPVWANGIR